MSKYNYDDFFNRITTSKNLSQENSCKDLSATQDKSNEIGYGSSNILPQEESYDSITDNTDQLSFGGSI